LANYDENPQQLTNTGFTLIELLVVVLIICILAAIALPQYQKAVERSRMAEAIQHLGAFAQAQRIYYMQHNEFAEDINEGDITIPEPGNAFEYETELEPSMGVILYATRTSGMYEDGILAIVALADGSTMKLCQDPAGKTGFCTMAEPSGYQSEGSAGGNSGDSNTGGGNGDLNTGISDKCMVECANPEGCC